MQLRGANRDYHHLFYSVCSIHAPIDVRLSPGALARLPINLVVGNAARADMFLVSTYTVETTVIPAWLRLFETLDRHLEAACERVSAS